MVYKILKISKPGDFDIRCLNWNTAITVFMKKCHMNRRRYRHRHLIPIPCVYLDTLHNESVLFYSIQIYSKPPKYLKWMLCWKLKILPLHKSFSRLENPRRTKLGSLYNSKTLKEEKCKLKKEKCVKVKRIVSLRQILNF